MMTRKDYVSTAEILQTYRDSMSLNIFENLVQDFASMFAEDNERFLVSKFEDACYGDDA
jgi:hypothetical protein